MTPRTAIVGAGPGGLTCARILQRQGFPVTVLDRDPAPDARPQGGTLDMHADSGQLALQAAGLLEAFLDLSRPEGQEMRLYDHTGGLLHQHAPPPGESFNPEIDRGQLRALLLDSLTPGTVQWGRNLTTLTPLGDGVHRAHFEDGSTADYDLVIGADGAWSRVRRLLSDAVPVYTGVTFVEISLNNPGTEISELVGEGTMMAPYDNKALIAQRNSGNRVLVYAALRVPQDWNRGPVSMRDELLERFADWSPRLLSLIAKHDGDFVNRPLFALPVPHKWDHTPGVTLLGDAAHLMSPFSGMGANLAMLDAADLANSIITEPTIDAAVQAYETVMIPRGAEAAHGADEGLNTAISPSTDQALAHLTKHL
ncbi:FAD-dependent oxidoreductase [Allokutzneria oryzae]|uniref:Flavin-dependent monooxygenase n=1 Tax=Allokutzneria oryzae TaxID=1378989 RepID=A0ABV6A5R5_9PSEU